jgi:uncharacterized OB-fold protein
MGAWRSEAVSRAIAKNGDEAFERFFQGLQKRTLWVTECRLCDSRFFPPQTCCPDCLNIDVGFTVHSGEGVIYAFTSMADPAESRRTLSLAMVELEGVSGRIFTMVDVSYEDLKIGMKVSVDYVEREGLVLTCFRPKAIED